MGPTLLRLRVLTTLSCAPQSPTLLHYTGYDECDLMPCVQEIENFMADTTSNLTVCVAVAPSTSGTSAERVNVFETRRP